MTFHNPSKSPRVSLGLVLPSISQVSVDTTGAFELQRLYARIHTMIHVAEPAFDTMWFTDHLMWKDRAVTEAITTLTWFAAQYPNLRFGHSVLCNGFREPALVAKMAANLSILTNGRYVLGLGAGWNADEHRGYNFPFYEKSRRLAKLSEGARVIRKLWTEPEVNTSGPGMVIQRGKCAPCPDILPQFMIGGNSDGARYAAAMYGDIWCSDSIDVQTYAALTKRIGWWHSTSPRLAYFGTVSLTDPLADAHIKGSVSDVIEQINTLITIGVRTFLFRFSDFPKIRDLMTFTDSVAPFVQGVSDEQQ